MSLNNLITCAQGINNYCTKMPRKMTTQEVLKLYGINLRTLQFWLKEGCPTAGKRKKGGKGRPTTLFDARNLSQWAQSHGKNPRGIEGAMLKQAQAEAPPEPGTQAQGTEPSAGAEKPSRSVTDPPVQLDAVRGQYNNLMARFIRLAKTGGEDKEVANISRALTTKGHELRQLEMAVLEWKKQTGILCDFGEMQRLFHDLASGTRERIMSLPNELAPALREYLRNTDDVGKVRDEIDQAIRHALTALPDKLPTKDI